MNKINLLVIDDSKDLVVTMNEYFKEHSNIIIKEVAHDGEEAIRLIQSKKDEYDLILMEPFISRKDGLSILEYMKDRSIDKPVIVFSSDKDVELMKRKKELGIRHFLLKPLELDILVKRIQGVMEEEYNDNPVELEIVEIQKQITKVIHDLGVPSNLKGYGYIREGIQLVYYEPNLAHSITKKLYPKIASKFESTIARVERSMRHAIEVSWNRGNWDRMEEIFGYSVSIDKAKPTNSEFIVTIADMLRLENNRGNA